MRETLGTHTNEEKRLEILRDIVEKKCELIIADRRVIDDPEKEGYQSDLIEVRMRYPSTGEKGKNDKECTVMIYISKRKDIDTKNVDADGVDGEDSSEQEARTLETRAEILLNDGKIVLNEKNNQMLLAQLVLRIWEQTSGGKIVSSD